MNRPLLATRTRRSIVTVTAALSAMFAGGVGVGLTLRNAPRVETISVPAPIVTVTVPPAPSPTVSVSVPPPMVPTPVAVPAGEIPRPRAPRLWSHCVLVPAGSAEGACEWDEGFPAISSDGTLIAHKHVPDDGGRGNPGLEIWFVDATTGKTVRTSVVMSPDEYEIDDGTKTAEVAKLHERVVARATKVQQTLDDGGYRTMAYLGSHGPSHGSDEAEKPVPPTTYADLDGSGAARIVDPSTNRVIWQHQFGVPGPTRKASDDDEMCGGWGMWNMDLWWDPTTRVVLANEWYRTGGCMCPDVAAVEVAVVPPR